MANRTNTNETPAAKFTKEQLAGAIAFADNRDAVNAILEDGRKYTLEEAKAAIENYMKGAVV